MRAPDYATPKVPRLWDEVGHAQLGHGHRMKRLAIISERIEANPERSIPKMMHSESEREGTYRFMNHPEVTFDKLMESHRGQTLSRATQHTEVLAIHDTTTIRFTGQALREGVKGLKTGGQGFELHTTLWVGITDGEREPLGVFRASPIDYAPRWIEGKEGPRKPTGHEHRKIPLEDKESYRWLEGIEAVEAQKPTLGRVIHVADRESDMYVLEEWLVRRQGHFVFRVQHDDRRISVPSDENPVGVKKGRVSLKAFMPMCNEVFRRQASLSQRKRGQRPSEEKRYPPRERRDTELAFRAHGVTLYAPQEFRGKDVLPHLTLHAVYVTEPNPPPGERPIEWMLLTTEPIDTEEDIARIVDMYRCRWLIEEYFKALKTGCRYQQRQLESKHALLCALGLFIPMAWILLLLRYVSRTDPGRPASTILSDRQLKILRARSNRMKSDVPSVKEALSAIADLGGHFKHNGEPGWLILYQGWESLLAYEQGWILAELHAHENN
jgi:hypothetical protein